MNYQSYEGDSVSLDRESPFLNDHLSRYHWIQSMVKDKTVLDCACGKGYGSFLISQAAHKTTGVDLNDESLAVARSKFSGNNLSFVRADVLTLSKCFQAGSLDVVVAFEIIEHIPPETTHLFLNEIVKVLKPGGRLILSTPNHDVVLKSGVEIPDFHINNFKAVELKRVLRAHFERVELFGQFARRGTLNFILFSADVFNFRHRLRSVFKSEKASGLDPRPSTSTPIDADFLLRYREQENVYRFSRRHWRQAGLTVAIAEGAIPR